MECEWNIEPATSSTPPRHSIYRNLRQRLSQRRFERLLHQPISKPRLRLTTLLAYAIALGVHMLTLALLAGSVYVLLFSELHRIWRLIGGGAGLAAAWILRPRLQRRPAAAQQRAALPATFALVDHIAAQLGIASVDGIVIGPEFAASLSQDWRRRSYLTLGLPLWIILTPAEKVALIGHELGHKINNDPARRFWVHAAIESLVQWDQLLRPEQIFAVQGRGIMALLLALFYIPVNLGMLLLAQIARFVAQRLVQLIYLESQQAEYYADHIAAQAAGTTACQSLLRKTCCESVVSLATQQLIVAGKQRPSTGIISAIRQSMAAMPAHETERLWRVNLRTLRRSAATHPPTDYRIQLQQAHAAQAGCIDTPALDIAAADSEIEQLEPAIQHQMIDNLKHALYGR